MKYYLTCSWTNSINIISTKMAYLSTYNLVNKEKAWCWLGQRISASYFAKWNPLCRISVCYFNILIYGICQSRSLKNTLKLEDSSVNKGGHIKMTAIIKIGFIFAVELAYPVIIEISARQRSLTQQPYKLLWHAYISNISSSWCNLMRFLSSMHTSN